MSLTIGILEVNQNLGTFTLNDGSGDVTLTLESSTVTISEPYKIINVGLNTYLKDDKYYIPLNDSETKYSIVTLDIDFDTSILDQN